MTNTSEEFRHECEVSDWIRRTKGNHEALKIIMASIEKKRGEKAANRLRKDIWEQLKGK